MGYKQSLFFFIFQYFLFLFILLIYVSNEYHSVLS